MPDHNVLIPRRNNARTGDHCRWIVGRKRDSCSPDGGFHYTVLGGLAALAPALLREFGLDSLPRTRASGIRVLFAWDSDEKNIQFDEVFANFRLRIWRQDTSPPVRETALRANTKNETIAGYARSFDPGSYWVQLTSPQLRIDRLVSVAVLASYETTLLIEVRNSRDVGLVCTLAKKTAPARSPALYAKQSLAQRAMRLGRMDMAHRYAEFLTDSITDELPSACLKAYTTLAFGAGETESGDFTATFRERFPSLSDAHLLWATFAGRGELRERADVERAYHKAAAPGAPIFSMGLIGLADECESILANPNKQLILGDNSELAKMVLYRDALVPGQHLTVLRAQAVLDFA
jgi:hypothetical protein